MPATQPKTTRPKAPKLPEPWSSNNDPPSATQQNGPVLTPGELGDLTAPPVPGSGSGQNDVVVNTDALDTFASNVNSLIAPVKDALTTLEGLPKVAAGGFPEAYTISDQVSGGPSSGTGSGSATDLADSYKMVLNYLANGLTDIAGAANNLSTTYSTADDLNNATAADVTNALNSATSDFNNLLTADGGSPPSTSTPPSTGS
jgi:hypothetical protein